MNVADPLARPKLQAMTNGSGAAAILSAAFGAFTLAIIAITADNSAALKSMLTFYKPTGPLSGVTTVSILVWLLTWVILEWRWAKKTVALGRVSIFAFTLLALSFLLTFPPIADLF
jgi:hypothetical protein